MQHTYDMVMSLKQFNDVTDQCVAVHVFFIFPTGWYGVCEIESIIGVQWGQKNPNPRAHSSTGKQGLPSFPLNGGLKGWDFSGTTEHQ